MSDQPNDLKLTTLSPAILYETCLPKDIVLQLREELDSGKNPNPMENARVSNKLVNTDIRKCKTQFITTNVWIGGFIWHYLSKANRDNFMYDIHGMEGEHMSYIVYNEGDFYTWHMDHDIDHLISFINVDRCMGRNIGEELLYLGGECVRKLSFSLQLSSPDEYEGGELQLLRSGHRMKPELFTAPKSLGMMTVFDSRIAHRVKKVKSGTRRSLVGWVIGPRWK